MADARMTLADALQLAMRHHAAGRIAEAETIYRQILAHAPATPDALHLLGVAAHHRGDARESETLIRRAIELAPGVAGYHSNLGNALQAQARLADAADEFRRAVALDPRHHQAWNNLGAALHALGQAADAIDSLRRSIALRPDYASAHSNLGNALRTLGQFADAESHYRQAIALNAQYVEAHHNLSVVLTAQHRPDEAAAAARAALALRPDYPDAHHALAVALEAAGRTPEAIDHYARAVQLKPDCAPWQFDLAAARGADRPASMPESYVAQLFDAYAGWFDAHLTGALEYRTPQLLLDMVRQVEPRPDLDTLDLGCGTGLSGACFKPTSRRLVGVDLSPRMLEAARARHIYDELALAEMTQFAAARPQQFDLVVAADALVYVGDLRPLFTAVAAALRPGALFAFSVEAADAADYELRPTRRYAHAPAYVERIAAEAGLRPEGSRQASLRKQNRADVIGWLWVLRRT